MPPRRRSKAPVTVELPEPLWAKIASHLSTKDWAMVSGTCKTTFNLQPRTIDILSSTPPEGVVWASKRLGDVEVLRLRPHGALGLAGTGVQDPDTLMRLKQLKIIAPSAADTAATFMMWFVWVLSRCQELTLLSAVVGHLEWFPPMMKLRHLILRCYQSTGNIFAALRFAKSLQTLSLHAGRLSGAAMVLDAPCLELGSLPDLQAVALHGVCPSNIELPQECGLHLAGLVTLELLEDEEWQANLRSLDFVNKRLFLTELPDMFDTFQDLQHLSVVALDVKNCGEADAPVLLADLAHVQQYYFGAVGQLYVTVPAKVSWQKLRLCGIKRMEVTFEDMEAFARTVKECAFSSRNLEGPSLFELCLVLAERGTPRATVRHDRDITLTYPTIDAGDFPDCCCGACMKCLRASGVAEACSSVPPEDEAVALGEEGSEGDEEQNEDEEEDQEDSEQEEEVDMEVVDNSDSE